jgi:N-dimethylarginine dimethylaminohydrolase
MTHPNPRILMCPPEFYGIEYEINPWMHRDKEADRERAHHQWTELHQTLVGLGVKVELITPAPGLPDLVFTANAGLVHRNRFVPSKFRHAQRQGESQLFVDWFRNQSWEIRELPSGDDFEGAGDALYCGDTLFAGYLHRSEIGSHRDLAEMLGCQVLSLELVDPRFYHLDTCFCPLSPGVALYFPGAFDEYGRRVLQENLTHLVEVEEPDAVRFGCNAVVVGPNVVHNAGCEKLALQLNEIGFTSHSVELGEFLKAGGSAKCLTLRLDGEEAAVW